MSAIQRGLLTAVFAAGCPGHRSQWQVLKKGVLVTLTCFVRKRLGEGTSILVYSASQATVHAQAILTSWRLEITDTARFMR